MKSTGSALENGLAHGLRGATGSRYPQNPGPGPVNRCRVAAVASFLSPILFVIFRHAYAPCSRSVPSRGALTALLESLGPCREALTPP